MTNRNRKRMEQKQQFTEKNKIKCKDGKQNKKESQVQIEEKK